MVNATLVNVMMEFKDGRVLVNCLLLSLWPFLVLINDLDVDNLASVWNYVNETAASEVVRPRATEVVRSRIRLRSGLRRIESNSIARNVRSSGYLL